MRGYLDAHRPHEGSAVPVRRRACRAGDPARAPAILPSTLRSKRQFAGARIAGACHSGRLPLFRGRGARHDRLAKGEQCHGKATDHLGRPIVAVTGIGIVTSLGVGKTDNWAALTSGRSGIHAITRFPTDHLNTRIAGTVDFLQVEQQGASAADLRARRDRGGRGDRPSPASTRRFRRTAVSRLAAGRARAGSTRFALYGHGERGGRLRRGCCRWRAA